ncbi:MoxR family ATPase [Myxococcota bacterium]|nr:MoxR family ATPase [Myxococcota bacterium]
MNPAFDLDQANREVAQAGAFLGRLRQELGRVVVGQSYLMDRLLLGLLTSGHLLLEGVPGLAKTTAVKALATAIHTHFRRIQFTPDLLPADLVGTQVYQPQRGEFTIKKGPIFANIVLADEINRAPAKVQSALLEAMQERQVTIGETTFPLPDPFLVLATQNPIEQEGTYPLPEAQVDRFMLKLRVGYPTRAEEKEIVKRAGAGFPEVQPVIDPGAILAAREALGRVHLDDRLVDYIVDLVHATRDPKAFGLGDLASLIQFGASPRASIYLQTAARAWAFLQGRAFVTPQDVKSIAADVLRHRVILTYEAEAEELTPDAVVERILARVPVP